MELPSRNRGDELLPPGEMTRIRARLRRLAASQDLKSVIVHAFDHRTRRLPFLYADLKMAPAGVRAIGAAMVDSGFAKTRVVLQQWNPHFRPSAMRLDGEMPDLFMVSTMHIHSARYQELIRDACRIDAADRPLVIAGGPKAVYQPWELFGADPADPWGADVVVTGEEYVLLNLLEVVCSIRGRGESMRSAFYRARDCGALDEVPGLVYPHGRAGGAAEELVDTGIQRLLGDLDELPDAALGYELLEPPGRCAALAAEALSAAEIHKRSPIAAVVLTMGCKFGCPYCPVPAYNQRKYRTKSGQRISDEIGRLYQRYRLRVFFGADDNFFNDKRRTLDIAETLVRNARNGKHAKIRWGTEATIHDTLQMRDHLSLVREAGLWALWLGVEDVTGKLVKKGQQADKTLDAFHLLRENGIFPIPMMMHHDAQPLYSRRDNSGLINQLKLLRGAGALSMQVLMLTPAVGSRSFEEVCTSGLAYESIGGIPLEPWMTDGNHIVASRHPQPWLKQFNLLAAYVYFYNPLRLLLALVRPKSMIRLADAEPGPPESRNLALPPWKRARRRVRRKALAWLGDAAVQLFGMWGVARYTAPGMLRWSLRLARGKIERTDRVPTSETPMRSPEGGPAAHALPGTPLAGSPVVSTIAPERKKAA